MGTKVRPFAMTRTTESTLVETIRLRPGMFVGDVHDGTGLDHVLWEVVGNALDQHFVDRCSRIEVHLRREGGATVSDDGDGIPTEPDASGRSILERALTELHDTPTLDGHAPHVHLVSRDRGVGLVAVNALASALEVEVRRRGRAWRWRFARGVARGPIEDLGATDRHGTSLTFVPDVEIFHDVHFDRGRVWQRLTRLAYLAPRLTIALRDDGVDLHRPRGLVDRVDGLVRQWAMAMASPILAGGATHRDGTRVDFALAWRAEARASTVLESFVNYEPTREGGTHVAGLLRAVVRLAPGRGAAVKSGLVAAVAVVGRDVAFGSPTRDKLLTPAIGRLVYDAVAERLRAFVREDPDAVAGLLARPGAERGDA
jgi:DNA gyrase subunit B